MGLLAKAKPNTQNKGMGFLLVFFPEDDNNNKTKLLSSSPFKTTTSNGNVLLSKAQSTIYICALLCFITLMLFTLSTIPSTTTTNPLPRRFLLHKTHYPSPKIPSKFEPFTSNSKALQRMGTLYLRGTRPMNDLVVGHVVEDTTEEELRLFLRVLHRSGVTSKSDIVFVFASHSMTPKFANIVREENDSFLSLVQLHAELNSTRLNKVPPESGFDVTRFLRVGKKKVETRETIWGKRIRSNLSSAEIEGSELTRLSYGSVLSFDASELDPENSLAGFMDRVPLSLRRWACYPMLLGRVRRNFKHVMLVDVKNIVIFNDPLGRVRNRSSESVLLFAEPNSGSYGGKHGKKNSVRTQSQHLVNSAIVMGGARGVRRLSNVMVVEIVRVAMQHKKNSVSESVVLSQLVRNAFLLKNVDLITSSESIPETSSLAAHDSAGFISFSDYAMVPHGTSNYDLNSVIRKRICSFAVDSSVYRDC